MTEMIGMMKPGMEHRRFTFCYEHGCRERLALSGGYAPVTDEAMISALMGDGWSAGPGGLLASPICPNCTRFNERARRPSPRPLRKLYP